MVLLFHDPCFRRHDTGRHPESSRRLEAIDRHLQTSGLMERCGQGTIRLATREELLRVHPAEYLERVERFARQGGGYLDADTVVSPASYEVAVTAAGTALAAVDAVLTGQAQRALSLVRPPGHHALSNQAMGFCLLNHVALAAAHARTAHQLERILIVDWDVHHGNGTQDIFYDDGQVHFLSLHRFPFYPGTGAADETGTGAGLGATLNVPLTFGISRRDYLSAFSRALNEAATRCRPELILLSAGFDAHAADPIGSLGLESEDFGELTRLLCEAAAVHCAGRIVSLLEGGYHVEKLGESVVIHLTGLLENA